MLLQCNCYVTQNNVRWIPKPVLRDWCWTVLFPAETSWAISPLNSISCKSSLLSVIFVIYGSPQLCFMLILNQWLWFYVTPAFIKHQLCLSGKWKAGIFYFIWLLALNAIWFTWELYSKLKACQVGLQRRSVRGCPLSQTLSRNRAVNHGTVNLFSFGVFFWQELL